MPLGFDALVIVLAARYGELFWLLLPLVTGASLAAATVIHWVGRTAGIAGLPRLVPSHYLERIKTYVDRAGAGALAAAAVLPPPFPSTAVLLTCGALDFDRRRFLLVFGVMRLIRFGAVALLARRYGEPLWQMLDADGLQTAAIALAVAALTTTIAFSLLMWCRTRPQPA